MRILQNSVILPDSKLKESVKPTRLQQTHKPGSFGDVLSGKVAEQALSLQFSKHANMRLDARNISLTNTQMKRVADGVDKAREKGIKESLVLVDNVALLVNVRSKTVVTAMGKENENIFTNIDGAVIV